jgi:FSR family fosmidomycin resistance protein-like MFS transporter
VFSFNRIKFFFVNQFADIKQSGASTHGVDAQQRINPLAYLLMAGHICVDAVQGGLSAVLPFLVLWDGYSYLQITTLVLASNIASAVIQPLFGWLGDRVSAPWLMAVGALLGGIGIAGIGLVGIYWAVVLFALLSGIGNAMLHPEGGRLANLIGGARKAETMSIFSVGGQIGFCLGPVVTVAAVNLLGLAGLCVYLVLCIPVSFILFVAAPTFKKFGIRDESLVATEKSIPASQNAEGGEVKKVSSECTDRWGAFFTVLGALSIRSVVFYGVTALVPLYLVAKYGASEQISSLVITVFSLAGAVATLSSGRAARVIRVPLLMVGCFSLLCAAVIALCVSPSVVPAVIAVMVVALCINLFNPAAITLSQDYVPNHLGMASGLSFGVAVCVGGIASPALGAMADALGVTIAIWALLAAAIVGLVISIAVSRLR